MVSVVKEGFGVTICDDATKSSLKYQCFKPTNTAPPFLATATGLRTIPQGLTDIDTDAVNSVKVHASSAVETKIICSSFFMSGNYGNNSPGINTVPSAFFHNTSVSQHEPETGNYFQPGGVIQNDTDDVYNRLIEFENINQFGEVQRFQLIGTTRSDPTLL